MVKIGFCDNPITQSKKLIPNPYMMVLHGGIQKFKKLMPKMTAVEVQFLQWKEVPSSSKKLSKYFSSTRALGIDIVAHTPFLVDKNKKGKPYIPLNIDYCWPIVPSQYKNKPLSKINDIEINAKKVPLSKFSHLIKVLGELKVPYLTIHVMKSGLIYNDRDWKAYLKFMKWLYKISSRYNLTPLVETGGISDSQISDVIKQGFKMNFDPAHYFLEMRSLGKSVPLANKLTFKMYKKLYPHVRVMHLAQPTSGVDMHYTLLDKRGALTCIPKILKHQRKHKTIPFIIFETLPDKKALDFVTKILKI